MSPEFIVYDMEQGSEEWALKRSGTPTASEFSKLVTSKGEPSKSMETYAMTLAAELFAGKPLESFEGNSWTDRGKVLEPAAAALYQFERDCEIQPVGFVTTPDGRWGCSPDGLVGDDGVVEFKCLKTENHVKTLLYYRKHGRCPTDYVQQTQGEILIPKRQWCDLVFYHPELPMFIIRQHPDDKVISGLQEQLEAVIARRDEILNVLRETA